MKKDVYKSFYIRYKKAIIISALCVFVIASFIFFKPKWEEAYNKRYLDYIELSDKKIDFEKFGFVSEAYLYVTVNNKGDRNLTYLLLDVSYFDENNYLIGKISIAPMPVDEIVPQKTSKRYKTELSFYPFSQKVKYFTVEKIECAVK